MTVSAQDGVLRIPEGVEYATSYYAERGIRVDDTGIHEFRGVADTMIVPKSVKRIESILEFSGTENFTCIMKGNIPPKITQLTTSYLKSLTVYVPIEAKELYERAWEKTLKKCVSLNVSYIEMKL